MTKNPCWFALLNRIIFAFVLHKLKINQSTPKHWIVHVFPYFRKIKLDNAQVTEKRMWANNDTYPESRVGSQLQQTLDSWYAQVGGSDVQGGAEVKVTAGGIYLFKNKKAIGRLNWHDPFWGMIYTQLAEKWVILLMSWTL